MPHWMPEYYTFMDMRMIYLAIRILAIFNIQFSILNIQSSSAQPGEWTWLHGSNSFNSAGNFGTQGVPSATNEPPALYEPCEWTDLNGNYWMYGGFLQGTGMYNDLWRYNPTTNQWT